MSITLTNIYLTYKREIIVHIKFMLMAVTYIVQSNPGSSHAKKIFLPLGGRWKDAVEAGLQWGWALVGTLLQTRSTGERTLAHSDTKGSRAGTLRCQKGILKFYRKEEKTTTATLGSRRTGICKGSLGRLRSWAPTRGTVPWCARGRGRAPQ